MTNLKKQGGSGNIDLPDGMPTVHEYKALLRSEAFQNMEKFSDPFVVKSEPILKKYNRRWVSDPFHHWSRRWEYPFVDSRIKNPKSTSKLWRILDAGSGITFFPYYLSERNDIEVHCCDSDETLPNLFSDINERNNSFVKFRSADLRDLPYEQDYFRAIYSISVLEHTQDYERILRQFHRILEPGGNLIISFDISLDGGRDISVEKAKMLLKSVNIIFDCHQDLCDLFVSQLEKKDFYTTRIANQTDPDSLPWRAPRLLYVAQSFLKSGRLYQWPPELTVFCLCVTKKSC